MKIQEFDNVWDAVCDTPIEAENLKLRSKLMRDLSAVIADSGINQVQAAELMGVTQPRISDLVRGKIDLFSLDALVNMAASAGRRVVMELEDAV
ncbi:MAG: XRE family transcriptional regulator [Azoarcus sp.]|jgi:predicted XRE-type DNA-binding protein|nr:XRE family transcriptional regulator [Azoarcus sp.]